MNRYMEKLDEVHHSAPCETNNRLMAVLELEDENSGEFDNMTGGFLPEIEESTIKEYLPSIYSFTRHYEWNSKEQGIINERLYKAVYRHYIMQGFENEPYIDTNSSIQNFLKKNKKDLRFVEEYVDKWRKLYFRVYMKLVMYSEHFNGIVISLLSGTLRDINDYNYGLCSDSYIECVLFVYGLYMEILEIYNPIKTETAPF